MTALLRLQGMRLSLPVAGRLAPVLHGVDLAILPGEAVGLVGESGSGKSSLALAAMRLEPPGAVLAGRLAFGALDLLAADEAALCRYRGRQAAMVFQEPMTALNPLMRVEEQVAEPLRRHGRLPRRAALARARELLARVGLAAPHAALGAWPHQLSGGQRQRAVIAMALAGEPALLIADEPTSALDVLVQRDILDLLAEVTRERGTALLLIGHDLAMMRRSVGRLLVLQAGRVVEEGTTADVLERPRHPYTQSLLAASVLA